MNDERIIGGVPKAAVDRYIREQIYSLPGIDDHEEKLSILLTGSRATGEYSSGSDVDIDVLCSQEIFETLHAAALKEGIVKTAKSFFVTAPETGWEDYFGGNKGRPHFSVTNLGRVGDDFACYRDIPIWIWTNARVLSDPGNAFGRIRDAWKGYPPEVLVRKIKYHWLLAGYWSIEVFPHNHQNRDEFLPAASAAISNTVLELLRVFFLIDGEPYPYPEVLMKYGRSTSMGARYLAVLQKAAKLATGAAREESSPWVRLQEAFDILNCYDTSPECREWTGPCEEAMVRAGVEPEWMKADYSNIHELLNGELGPAPE